jgi:hypothetical protein
MPITVDEKGSLIRFLRSLNQPERHLTNVFAALHDIMSDPNAPEFCELQEEVYTYLRTTLGAENEKRVYLQAIRNQVEPKKPQFGMNFILLVILS